VPTDLKQLLKSLNTTFPYDVAGLLDLCTNFCWAVYKPYHIIHAEACINWQDV